MKILHQTMKAYLLSDDVGKFWIPKKLCSEGDENEVDSIRPGFNRKYIEKHPIGLDDGEDIDFSVPVRPRTANNAPVQTFSIQAEQSKVNEEYEEWQKSGSSLTFAEWAGQELPF